MYTRKIGSNRGKRRLWLEGAILLESGFTHKASFRVTATDKGLRIELSADGNRNIAGTQSRPIVDINSDTVLGLFDIGSTVNIVSPSAGVLEVIK